MADINKEQEAVTKEAAAQEEAEASQAETSQEEAADEEVSGSSCDEEETADEEEEMKNSRLFGRKDKKKDKKDQQIEELNDRVMRQMAEFDNYRKRTEKEKSQMFDSGAGDVIEKILPILDDMERGLQALGEEERETSFAKGMEMIYKKLQGVLDAQGVTVIEVVGKEFDPNFHNAVMQSPSEEYESGYVINELQKGYMFKDRVLRHSMVIVAE